MPGEPGIPGGLWHEQRELLTGGRLRPGEFQPQPGDCGRGWCPFQAGEQESFDGLGVRGGFREPLRLDQLPGRARRGEGEIQVQPQAGFAAS